MQQGRIRLSEPATFQNNSDKNRLMAPFISVNKRRKTILKKKNNYERFPKDGGNRSKFLPRPAFNQLY